ncbi:MAG: 4Fe-4S ferredoxin [Thermodesulfovibrio sp.]|nr:4Fe-4S ferredoxin [Thermodesulfovibrio sp.]
MTTIRGFQPYRRAALVLQAVIILGLPFLKIRGESAVRFDLPSLRLHFFGRALWIQEFFVVLIALLFFTFLILLVTLLFGRIWCGWLCPQTALTYLTEFAGQPAAKNLIRNIASYAGVFGVSLLVGANLIWYFVTPAEFFTRLLSDNLGPAITWAWSLLTIVLFADLAFIRHRFCATVCPYSRMQSTLFDSRTMVIAFDMQRSAECMDCAACVRTCPVGIDIRKGLSPACVSCAQCVDACAERLAKKDRQGLIGYFFGLPGQGIGFMRRNVLLVSAVTLSLMVFLVLLASGRQTLDMTVMPAHNFPPRITTDGKIINAYLIAFENRGSNALQVHLSALPAPASQTSIALNPATIMVRAGEHKTATVFAEMRDVPQHNSTVTFTLSADYGAAEQKPLLRKAVFAVPGKP